MTPLPPPQPASLGNEEVRHLAVLWVDAGLMRQLFNDTPAGESIRITHGVPPGAIFIATGFDKARVAFAFMFEHPSFPAVVTGAPVEAVIEPLCELVLVSPPEGG